MKLFLIIGGGFILFFVCLIPLSKSIDEYNAQKNGELITAVITELPNCSGSRTGRNLKFRYNNTIYSKQAGKHCDEYSIGQALNLKHIPGTDIFLYENEKAETELISLGLIGIIALSCIIYGFVKK